MDDGRTSDHVYTIVRDVSRPSPPIGGKAFLAVLILRPTTTTYRRIVVRFTDGQTHEYRHPLPGSFRSYTYTYPWTIIKRWMEKICPVYRATIFKRNRHRRRSRTVFSHWKTSLPSDFYRSQTWMRWEVEDHREVEGHDTVVDQTTDQNLLKIARV